MVASTRDLRPQPCSHHVANPREPEGSLCLTATSVVARVAIDGLIGCVVPPIKIRGEVRAALHASIRVDVNGAYARPTGLPHLAAHVPRNLLEVVVGVRDDAARAALERQQIGNQRIEAGVVIRAKEKGSIPVLGVRV